MSITVSKAIGYAVLTPSSNALWCGGEETDLVVRNEPAYGDAGVTTGQTAGRFRAAYADGGIQFTTSSSGIQLGRGDSFEGGAVTSCWLSFHTFSSLAAGGDARPCRLIKAGGHAGIGVGYHFSGVAVELYNTAGVALRTITVAGGQNNTLHKIDMQVIDFNSATGQIKVWLDGELVVNQTWDMSGTGATELDAFGLYSASNGTWCISEIVVADGDTRTVNLHTLRPEGVGFIDQWTGDYQAIDEVPENDADSVSTNTTGTEIAVKLTDLP